MGEALISGAGGGTGKIYKWKRYEINSKTIYTWDKWSLLETTEYKWNKWNIGKKDTTSDINISMQTDFKSRLWTGFTISESEGIYRGSGALREEYGNNNQSNLFLFKNGNTVGIQDYGPVMRESLDYYTTTSYNGHIYIVYNGREHILVDSKGSISYGQVTSTSPSAYPSNGASGSYWYVSAGSTTSTSKGSTSYGQVESESSSAYPNGGAQGGYWYENRNSRIEQSIGSYKDQVYSTARNTYPDNGIQGGYWYVFEEV